MAVEATQVAGPARGAKYGWYVTAVLMFAYAFSYLDRQILSLMIGPIRHDLGISDHEFGLLAGAAFGLFYATLGLPIGWIADRSSRKRLIASGIFLWSLATALCGLTRTYAQLFIARVGVGVGEATLSPATYSLLADYFDKRTLPRAMSLYSIGVFMGAGAALIIGGEVVSAISKLESIAIPLLGEIRPWQAVFMVVGLPGIALALLVAATVDEPVRRGKTQNVPFSELFRFIRHHWRMCVAFFLGSGVYSIIGYTDTWYPELFIRTWGWTAAEAGRVNGASSLIAGPLGLLFAGWYSSRMMSRGQTDICLRLSAYAAIGIGIPAVLLPMMPSPIAMATLLFPFKFFLGFPLVLVSSAIQMVAPNRLRAQLGAVFLFSSGIIGVTCGPILPGLFTDYVFKEDAALKYSLTLTASLVAPLALGLLWSGLSDFRRTLIEAEQQT